MMKTKEIVWDNLNYCNSGIYTIGHIISVEDEFSAHDLFDDTETWSSESAARAWVEKQFTGFITSISAEGE